jgi:hypothetical protein
MDSFSKLVADITSWHWWVTVVLVGLAINLASAYLKPRTDRLFDKLSAGRREKDESRRLELHRKAEELASEPTLLLIEGLAEMRDFLFALILALSTFGMAGVSMMFARLSFGETYLNLIAVLIPSLIGLGAAVLFITRLNRAVSRSQVIELARYKLSKAKGG